MMSGELAIKEWIQVDINGLRKSDFLKTKFDGETYEREENIRRLICEALAELRYRKTNNEKFEVSIPQRTNLIPITGGQMASFAQANNGHLADWVELSIYWAQLIQQNGWEYCHQAETHPDYRVVVWKNGKLRLTGGATRWGDLSYLTHIGFFYYEYSDEFGKSVPLIARE